MANRDIGDNIRRFREARGMLQKDLGERIGKKAGTISNWELGLRDPGADNLKLIAAALEIAPSELIGHNETVLQDSQFEVLCTDDYMSPEILPGDRVLATKAGQPKSGDIVVADLPNGGNVIRLYIDADGVEILLPVSREHRAEHETDFSVTGRVIGVSRKL